MGRAVAVELAKQGAHVTIVARKEGPLKETIELMKVIKMTSTSMDIGPQAFSFNHPPLSLFSYNLASGNNS